MTVGTYRTALKTVVLFVVACLAMRMLLTRNWRTEVLQNRLGASHSMSQRTVWEILLYLFGGILTHMVSNMNRPSASHLSFMMLHVAFVTIGLAIFKGQWPKLPLSEQGA